MEHPLWHKASRLASSIFRRKDEKYGYKMVDNLKDVPSTTSSASALEASECKLPNNSNDLDEGGDHPGLARWEFTSDLTIRMAIVIVGLVSILFITSLLLLSPLLRGLEPQSAAPPPTRVRPRQYPSFYYGKGCNSSQLLQSLSNAKVSSTGVSRLKASSPGPASLDFIVSNFTFSFDLPGCPPPHVFTPAETCDLVSAFGGIFFQGDSLMRDFKNALYLLLTNSLVIVRDLEANCTGSDLFVNRIICREHTYWNSTNMEHVCPLEPYTFYDQVWTFFSAPDPTVPKSIEQRNTASSALSTPDPASTADRKATHRVYDKFISELPESRRKASPVFLHATGIHYRFNSTKTKYSHIDPYLNLTAHASPQPIKLWPSYMAAGPNKPKAWVPFQGSDKVVQYNREVAQLLEATSSQPVSFGGWKQLEFFNITEAAYSSDGTHFGIQVNMEKVMILLNLLDTIWGEIVDAGGLLEE